MNTTNSTDDLLDDNKARRRRLSLHDLPAAACSMVEEAKEQFRERARSFDDCTDLETLTCDTNDKVDIAGNLIETHKKYTYTIRRRRAHSPASSSTSQDDDESEIEIEKHVVTKYPSCDGHQEGIQRTEWTISTHVTHYHDLPSWLQDNQFLISGHRRPMPDFVACLKSVFAIHTETLNIWTHLIGCLFFLSMGVYFWWTHEFHYQDSMAISVFFCGVVACLALSSIFHTLSCHSESTMSYTCKLDYCGISMLIATSIISWVYYCFYCRTQPKVLYMGMAGILGAVGIYVSLKEEFSHVDYKPLRAGIYIAMSSSGIVPLIHFGITDGFDTLYHETNLGRMGASALVYAIGAALYAFRIPERWWPGKFDIVFQSHQLFHVMVVLAAFVHYQCINELAWARTLQGECRLENASPAFLATAKQVARWADVFS